MTKIVDHKALQGDQKKIEYGNLVILPNATNGRKQGWGIFINHAEAIAFDLNGDSSHYLSNFLPMIGFESAVPIKGNYFAAAFREQGARIFYIDF